MGNQPTTGPSLGQAASEYCIPSEAARQQALQQKELAATLEAQGRTGVGLTERQKNLTSGMLVPSAYHIGDNGEQVTDVAIERDPKPYQHIFDKAKQTALQIQFDYEDITDEECFFIYLFAIQQAIDTLLRPDQQTAETQIDELTTEKLAQGENILSIEDIKQREAEVCTTKSMIAKHFFQEHYPQVTTTMISEAQYKGGKNGHNYLQLDHNGKRYEYHANSPHANGLPHIRGLSESQQVIMYELREQQQGQQAIRRELWPKKERRAA